jgi:hypothetical protein
VLPLQAIAPTRRSLRKEMYVLIHIFHTHIRTPEGLLYAARAYAEPQRDGRWESWLEFKPLDFDAPALTTAIETTQASRAAIQTWAEGLENTYLQGAFARARLASETTADRRPEPDQRAMAGKSIHVVPSGDEWVVEEAGQPLSSHRTQAEAEKFGRDEAIRASAELIVHRRDGQIARKNSYGRDPRDVKG